VSNRVLDAAWGALIIVIVYAAALLPKYKGLSAVRAGFELGRTMERRRIERRALRGNIDAITVEFDMPTMRL
jgi:hypothetical protein